MSTECAQSTVLASVHVQSAGSFALQWRASPCSVQVISSPFPAVSEITNQDFDLDEPWLAQCSKKMLHLACGPIVAKQDHCSRV